MLQIYRQELPRYQSHLHGGLQGANGQQPQVAFCFEAVDCAELDQVHKVKPAECVNEVCKQRGLSRLTQALSTVLVRGAEKAGSKSYCVGRFSILTDELIM